MKKPYLLIAGDNLYPEAGTDDWVACYGTYQEALSQVETIVEEETETVGKKKNRFTHRRESYLVKAGKGGREPNWKADWFEIVYLPEWTEVCSTLVT